MSRISKSGQDHFETPLSRWGLKSLKMLGESCTVAAKNQWLNSNYDLVGGFMFHLWYLPSGNLLQFAIEAMAQSKQLIPD